MEDLQTNFVEPSNLDAEVYVLGSVMLDNTIMASLRGKLKPTDFFLAVHRRIYEVMETLDRAGNVIDTVTIQEYYEVKGFGTKESILDTLLKIIDQVPSTAYIDTYTDIVLEKSIERVLLQNINKLKTNIINNKLSYNELLDEAENDLYEVIKNRKTSDTVTIAEAADEYYEEVIKRTEHSGTLTGMDTGIKKLNKLTNGLQPGEFIILAARPAVGKTAFALNLARNCSAINGANVAFFSLEMSVGQMMQRMFCMSTMIEADKIRTGNLTSDEKITLGVARQELQNLNIFFDESGSNTIGDIRAKCRQLNQTHGLDLLIIDYLQLINTTNKVRHEGVSEISRSLKQLARELKIPVIALSQLSRSIETREDKRPVLADLRESGSIEQDADIVMFLFKRSDIEDEVQSVFDGETAEFKQKPEEDENIKKIILKVEKNRQGQLGHVDLDFYGAQSYFTQSRIQQEIYKKKKQKKSKSN